MKTALKCCWTIINQNRVATSNPQGRVQQFSQGSWSFLVMQCGVDWFTARWGCQSSQGNTALFWSLTGTANIQYQCQRVPSVQTLLSTWALVKDQLKTIALLGSAQSSRNKTTGSTLHLGGDPVQAWVGSFKTCMHKPLLPPCPSPESARTPIL